MVFIGRNFENDNDFECVFSAFDWDRRESSYQFLTETFLLVTIKPYTWIFFRGKYFMYMTG